MKRILIVEDDKTIREELAQLLMNTGYETIIPDLYGDIVKETENAQPDLILLDVNLPHDDGFSLCRQIRQRLQTPIIFITGRDNLMDELNGLMLGGDDYITKPYNIPVLIARIHALLKRGGKDCENNQHLVYKEISLNILTGVVEYNNSTVELSKTELKILYYLFSNSDKIVPRIELVDFLWDHQIHIDDNTLSVNVTRLRDKLKQIGVIDLIKAKRGMGYKL